jgi:hypothetical protein
MNELLILIASKLQIIFSRPDARKCGSGYWADSNISCDYLDLHVVKQFEDALVLEEIAAQEGHFYSKAVKFPGGCASVHCGGSTHILAAFGNSLMAIHA